MTITDADLVELMVDHYQSGDDCHDCGGEWPCLIVQLVDALQTERAITSRLHFTDHDTILTGSDNSHDHPDLRSDLSRVMARGTDDFARINELLEIVTQLNTRVEILEARVLTGGRCLAITEHDGETVWCEKHNGHWNLRHYDPHKARLGNGNTLMWPG